MIVGLPNNSTNGWNSLNLSENDFLLSITCFGVFLHSLLWFQFFIHRIKFDFSFIFPICYISTDMFMFIGYFVQYSIRSTMSTGTWNVLCYFEGYFTLYFNMLESFFLTSLNICRYYQIVYNKQIYSIHRHLILFVCLIIPLLILVNIIVQNQMNWCIVIATVGSSCSLFYTSISIRIWNMSVLFTLPIGITFLTSIKCLIFLKRTQSQQMIIHRNHCRRLIYRYACFYTIWLILWTPLVILTFLCIETMDGRIDFIVTAGNAFESCLDGFILILLDKRFEMAWRKSFDAIRLKFGWQKKNKVIPRRQQILVRQNEVHLRKDKLVQVTRGIQTRNQDFAKRDALN